MPSFKLALVALAASLVSAQIDLSAIPTCALAPAVAALGESGCSETDIACVCESSSFLTSLLPAVEAACSAADLATAETFAKNLCLAAGVTISIPGAGATSAPPATSAAPSTSAAAPTTTSPAPVSSAPATGVSTVYVTVPCTTSVSGSAVPTKGTNLTATATKSATPSVFTGAASAAYVGGATMFGGLMAALAMLL